MSPSASIPLALLAAAAISNGLAVSSPIPVGSIVLPIIRNVEQTAYYAQMLVGTPAQKVYLKVDSGSPRYAVLDPSIEVCQRPGQLCKTFGTFDNLTSTTCEYAGPYFQDALIDYGSGDYLKDTITLGGVTTPDMHFGYTSKFAFSERAPLPPATIMGLSLDCAKGASLSMDHGAYLLPQLKKAGSINHMATSFYLGPDRANVSNALVILGSTYDRAKVDGRLFTVDMVDPFSMEQTNNANVTSLEVVVNGSSSIHQSYGEPGVGSPVLLDTGIATWYLPKPIFNVAWKALGGSPDYTPAQSLPVDCRYRDPANVKGYISVEFGSAGKVQIPLHSLVSQFADGTCRAFLLGRGDELIAFGDPFLRGVYSIFDQERFTISLSQVKHTQEVDLVPFPEGGFQKAIL